MNQLKQDYQILSLEHRRALWSVLSPIYAVLIITIIIYPTWMRPYTWAGSIAVTAALLLCFGPLASGGLILKSRPASGAIAFFMGIFIGMLALVAVIGGMGFHLAFVVFISSIHISGLLLSKRAFTWLPVISLLACAAIVLLDMYAVWPRWQLSAFHNLIFHSISGLLVAVYIFFMTFRFRSYGLGMKMVLIVLALTIVPIVVVGIISNRTSKQALEVSANQSLINSAGQISARLDSFMYDNLNAVRTEAALADIAHYLQALPDERVGSVLEERVIWELEAFRQRDPEFITSYALLDENGIVLIDTQGSETGMDLSDQDYFKAPYSNQSAYVSPVRYYESGDDSFLHFSAPVQNENGKSIGVLRMRYHAMALQQMIDVHTVQTGAQLYSILVDDNDMILANSLEIGTIGKSILPLNENRLRYLRGEQIIPEDADEVDYELDLPDLVSGLEDATQRPNFSGAFQTFTEIKNDSGEPQEQAGAKKMTAQPWYVVVVESRETLFEPMQRLVNVNLIVGIIAALFSTIFVIFIANYLVGPIVPLTDAARQFAQGNMGVRAPVVSEDEIGALARVFNQMAVQLNGLVGALETRVEERTRALAASAEISRQLSTMLDADQLVRVVGELLEKSFYFYSVRVYLLDDLKENLELAWGSGQPGKKRMEEGYSIPSDEGVWGRCVELAAPILLDNVYHDNGWKPDPLLPKTHSGLIVPVKIGDSVLGVIEIQHERENGLSQTDAELLQSIANQAAVAFTNARSFSAAQRRADREALISTINQRVQHTNSVEDALRVTARELGHALGVETVVRLGIRDKDRTG